MTFVEIIRRLWKRKLLVAGVFVLALAAAVLSAYRVTSSGLEKRALSVSAANSQILVDTSESPSTTKEVEPGEFEALETRAKIFAQYLAGLDARREIARIAGVPAGSLATSGPFSGSAGGDYNGQSAEERTSELLAEGDGNRASFISQEGVPIISVQTQAGSAETAIAIAAASFETLQRYIRSLEGGEKPSGDAIVVRELGAPEGGTVGGNNDVVLMALAFLLVFSLGCALILIAPSFAQRWRALASSEGEGEREAEEIVVPANGKDPSRLIVPPYGDAAAEPEPGSKPKPDRAKSSTGPSIRSR